MSSIIFELDVLKFEGLRILYFPHYTSKLSLATLGFGDVFIWQRWPDETSGLQRGRDVERDELGSDVGSAEAVGTGPCRPGCG